MDQNSPKEFRPPINLRIKFRSESIEQFIERYAVDVSRGGIFIRTREPLTVGTQLKLDFQFQNGSPLMAGEGTVVWIREVDPNRTNVPPGMGVRFDKLTPESQTVLEQLLVEKTKRERGGVPGSGSAGAGGMAVRRPSSMFSVLDPQAAAAGSQVTAAASMPAAPEQTPPSGPLAAVTSQLPPGLRSPVVPAPPENGEGLSEKGYRPIGAARNPFSAGASIPSSRPVEDSAPFDDLNDEPTQIAGKIPAFLSDEEATVVAAETFGVSPKTAGARAPLPGIDKPGVGRPGIGKMEQPAAGRKTGADVSTPNAGDLVGWKDALDQLLPSGPPSPAVPETSAKKVAAPTVGGHAKDTPKDKDEVAEKAAPPATAASAEVPKSAAVAPAVSAIGQAPPAAAAATAKPVDAKAPAAATAAPSATATAVRVAANKKRSPAVLIGVSVVVLAAIAMFLFRFFASESTEASRSTSTPGSSAPSVAGPAPSEAPSAPTPATAAPAAAGHEAAGGPDAGTAAVATAPVGSPSTTASTGTMPSTGAAPEPSVRKVTGKRRPTRGIADSATEAPSPAVGAGTPSKPAAKAGGGAPAGTAEGTTAASAPTDTKGESPSPAPGDGDVPEHQIRVTSKPDGADVTLDGQTVGKTPFSAGIADITAPHFIAVRKDGFETFEQMISSSSAWSKTKAPKGKGVIQVLKVNAKLKAIAGAAPVAGEARPATEPPASVPATDSTAKVEVVKPDRPMAPAEERPAAETAPK